MISPQNENDLRTLCVEAGTELSQSLRELLNFMPGRALRTGELAKALGIDKVLASRVLKTSRAGDPLATLHAAPGPEPLRRVVRAVEATGAKADSVRAADLAVEKFESLIREIVGDRSALNTLLSAWLPEARREFELRRKQSAYRAMSEIRGSSADTSLGAVLLHPSKTEGMIDIVWLFGVFALRRTRPGAQVRLTSRRVAKVGSPRQPMTLRYEHVEDLRGLRLQEFCSTPEVEIEVHDSGEVVRYLIADGRAGARSGVDLVFAEVNLAEIRDTLGVDATRSAYFFSEISIPVRSNHFDVLVHKDVYRGLNPRLLIYDTSFEGVASVNDRARDLDRLDMDESIDSLGSGVDRFRTGAIPSYARTLEMVFSSLNWDAAEFRGYRSEIEFPIYGTQVTMSFDPPGAVGH